MATRALAGLAAVLALVPAAAAAQDNRPIVWEGQTPTIRAPGAVPPRKEIVPPPGPTTTAEKIATGAGVAGASATLVTAGAQEVARQAESLAPVLAAEKATIGAKVFGDTASVVGLAANVKVAGEKCGDPKASTVDCVQAQLSLASSEVGVIDMLKKSPAGNMAQGLSVAADATGAYNKCWADAEATKLDCVAGLSDTFISATSNVPGGGKVIAATYSIAKTVLPAAVDAGGTWLLGQSPGAWFYDKFYAADDNARIEAEARSAALQSKQRAARSAAYRQAAGALQSKQADYEAQQARLEDERRQAQAQAQARAENAANAAFTQASINSAVSQLQRAFAPAPAAAPVSRSTPTEVEGNGCGLPAGYVGVCR